MAINAGTGTLTGSAYGDLSAHDAYTIQKKMLPIAKRLLTFGRFAQKEVKAQGEGLEIRHRRYERFPIVDTPVAEGITPEFDVLQQTTLKHTLEQFGSFVNTTDVQMAAASDPIVQIITERQAQQCGETLDFLSYKTFRAGTQRGFSNGSSRSALNTTIGGEDGTLPSTVAATTSTLDAAIRTLERNDAMKMMDQLNADDGVGTSAIRASYIAICHPDLRVDLERIPGFVSVENYADQSDVMDGEMGSARGIRFIGTTQAQSFKGAGASSTNVVNTGGSADVYPVIIMAQDFGGCATLGGKDSIKSKVVAPKPGPGDPLGQRGTVAWETFYSCIILQDLYLYRIECCASAI